MSSTIYGAIATYSGVVFQPLDPDPSLILIEDVAHALSNSCRFTGHVREFYSVAQHSVLCAELVSDENRLTALLHDASEAYLSDIARPIKYQPEFGDVYKKYENQLEQAIADKWGLEYPWPDEVKWADRIMLRTEQRDLMPTIEGVSLDGETLDFPIIPWSPENAEQAFLNAYTALVG